MVSCVIYYAPHIYSSINATLFWKYTNFVIIIVPYLWIIPLLRYVALLTYVHQE